MDEAEAEVHIYDPKVSKEQIRKDIYYLSSSLNDYKSSTINHNLVFIHEDPYSAMIDTHAVAILTEWEEFKTYDWTRVYNGMHKPAFIFDGRNILDTKTITNYGFKIKSIGKGISLNY